jgi:TolB-like protein/DNA-binding winged helix-turn-helix (wHTH) protein/Flp pilus assembly protein TadD
MEQTRTTVPDVSGYQIDDLIIDLGQQRVTRGGSEIPLPNLSFDLLVTLARSAPNFVSYDELTERVWPGLVITPETVSQRVKLVRDALGDDAHAPRYIAGIRGRGYRMVAAVKPLVDQRGIHTPVPYTDVSSDLGSTGPPAPEASAGLAAGRRLDRAVIAVLAVLALGLAYVVVDRFWISKKSVPVKPVASAQQAASHDDATVTVTAFNPPPHSIAVLPFVNTSGDKDQEYFSDGLTEELLNSLARINELQVAGRTSSFYFKGKDVDLGTVAHRLNVAAVLEGSVRRSANTVRVTAQLVNASTGFHLWSQTYDRSLGDVLALQTEIANAVAAALEVTMLGDVAARIELGGTRNPAALDAYLRATNAHFTLSDNTHESPVALAAYLEAVRLDPKFALALAGRSIALNQYAASLTGQAMLDAIDKALIDARQAITLAPELAEGHIALAFSFERSLDFAQATTEYNRALALAPGNARVLRDFGVFAVCMGRTDEGLVATRRAAVLDPLNPGGLLVVGGTLFFAHRYDEALAAFQKAVSLSPDYFAGYRSRGIAYYVLGDLQSARSSCESKLGLKASQACLAMVYDKLGRHNDAESALAKLKASKGDAAAYEYAQIYAQWGNTSKATEWLETARRLRDDGLVYLKTDPLLDPLRKEPRFQAIERELKFPD